MKTRRRILEENMTVVKDHIMFSEIKNIKVCLSVCLLRRVQTDITELY